MPTYGYQCKGCGHQFEVFQKMTDAAITACERCGAAVKKILYPVGIQFKGAGFYVNDYAKSSGNGKSAEATADTGGASDAAPAATESGTADSAKPEVKPEPKADSSKPAGTAAA